MALVVQTSLARDSWGYWCWGLVVSVRIGGVFCQLSKFPVMKSLAISVKQYPKTKKETVELANP